MLYLLEQWAGQQTRIAEAERSETWGDGIRGVTGCLEDAGLTKFQWQTAREFPGLAEPPINRFKLADGGTEDPRRSEEGKNVKGGKKDEGEGA
jgi:hypothetical protein